MLKISFVIFLLGLPSRYNSVTDLSSKTKQTGFNGELVVQANEYTREID